MIAHEKQALATLGFTGTRLGLSRRQKDHLILFLKYHDVEEAHHGDCIGGDEDFHKIVSYYADRIVIHPPTDERSRAFCKPLPGGATVTWRTPYDYLTRNRHIVDSTTWLVVGPSGPEELRSGTWSTKRYAEKLQRAFTILER